MCDSYSEDACKSAAQGEKLQLGGGGHPFAGTFATKGCYTYAFNTGSIWEGMAFYGTDGSQADMEAPPAPPRKYELILRVFAITKTTVRTM